MGRGLYMVFGDFKFGQDHPKYCLGVPRAFHMYLQGAIHKVPRGHAQKGDTISLLNIDFFFVASEAYGIVEHKT